MPYFISYIEINGHHAALMISEQKTPTSPTTVIAEVGFGPNMLVPPRGVTRNLGPLTGFFQIAQGAVSDEPLASQALYRTAKVQHRTFEISESELQQFYQFVEQDRQINKANIEAVVPEGVKVVGGPQYQYMAYNCKTWAVGMLKRMGVVDAKNLSNVLIQRSDSTKKLLGDLKTELACPEKEQYIDDFNDLIQSTEDLLGQLEADPSIDKDTLAEIRSNIDELKKISSAKIGIDVSFERKYRVLYENLDQLASNLSETHQQHKNLQFVRDKMQKQLESKVLKGDVQYIWKQTPQAVARLHTENFNKVEKAIYDIKIRTRETQDGLQEISSILGERKTTTPDEVDDTQQLLAMVQKASDQLEDMTESYYRAVDSNEEATVIQASIDQHHNLDKLSTQLIDQINQFQVKAPETHLFKKMAVGILSFAGKPTWAVKISPDAVLEKRLKALKENVEQRVAKENQANFELHRESFKITTFLMRAERDAQILDGSIYRYLDPVILNEMNQSAEENFLQQVTVQTYAHLLDNIEAHFNLSIPPTENIHERANQVQQALYDKSKKEGRTAEELSIELNGMLYQTNRELKDIQKSFRDEVKRQKYRHIKKNMRSMFKPLSNLWERMRHRVSKVGLQFKLAIQLKAGKDFQQLDQSTHLSTVHKSVKRSMDKLESKYNVRVNTIRIFKEIEQFIMASQELNTNQKNYALNTLHRAKKDQKKDLYTNKTIGETLALVWLAAQDDSVYGNGEPDLKSREMRLAAIVRNMALANREYNMDENGIDDGAVESKPACLAGHVNKLVEALDRVHPDVTIIQSQSVLSDYTVEVFDKVLASLPKEDQIALYRAFHGEDEPRGDEVLQEIKDLVRRQLDEFNRDVFDGDIDPMTIDAYIINLDYREPVSEAIEIYKKEQDALKNTESPNNIKEEVKTDTPKAGGSIVVEGIEISPELLAKFKQQFEAQAPMLRRMGRTEEQIAKRVVNNILPDDLDLDTQALDKVVDAFRNPAQFLPAVEEQISVVEEDSASLEEEPAEPVFQQVTVEGVIVTAEIITLFKQRFEAEAPILRKMNRTDEQIAARVVRNILPNVDWWGDHGEAVPVEKVVDVFLYPEKYQTVIDEPQSKRVAGFEVTAGMLKEFTDNLNQLNKDYSKIYSPDQLIYLALEQTESIPADKWEGKPEMQRELTVYLVEASKTAVRQDSMVVGQKIEQAMQEQVEKAKVDTGPKKDAPRTPTDI